MLKTSNNVILKNSNGVAFSPRYSLRLRVSDSQFPRTIVNGNLGTIQFFFSDSTAIQVDYGNGVVISYNTTFVGGAHRVVFMHNSGGATVAADYIPHYVYPDGLTAQRFVSFKFDANLLTGITGALLLLATQPLEFSFLNFPNIESFNFSTLGHTGGQLNGCFTSFNFNGFVTSKLTTFNTSYAFDNTFVYSKVIPTPVFSMPLVSLGIGGTHNTNTFATSNFDKIALLKETLTSLQVGVPFSDAQGLPANFAELYKLTTFTIPNVNGGFTTTPAVIRSMPGITSLQYLTVTSLTSLGDLSAMVGLESFTVQGATSISAALPDGLINLVKLKLMNYQSCFTTLARVNAFVDAIYAFITANAAMVGANTLPFRGMSILLNRLSSGAATPASPTGAYRQPLANVIRVDITNGGSGYTTTPAVTLSGGGVSGGNIATATAVLTGGVVTAINVTYAGYGYTSVPAVSFSGGGGAGAAATAVLGQPYVQGVGNGNPISQKEKLWVLVNQYGSTVSYA